MSRSQRYLPLITFGSGMALGFHARGSWLNFFSMLGGIVLVTVGLLIWVPIDRRRKRKAARPKLERLLDEMIAVAESPGWERDRAVIYNLRRETDDMTCLSLQVLGKAPESGSPPTYCLNVETLKTSRRARRIHVSVKTYPSQDPIGGVSYPDIAGWAEPEPWLTARLLKLRSLVGDDSVYESRKRRLRELGLDLKAFGLDP